MKTPYFLINEKELINNINEFKNALEELWSNYKIAFSVKTNSLPWLLKYMNEKNIMAETVSDEEYELAKLCGFNGNDIIFNGPIKTNEYIKKSFRDDSIVNIDSKNEMKYIEKIKPNISRKFRN